NLAGVDCFEQFPVPMCMMALVDILSAVNGTNAVIEGLCLKCLCLLGEKLKEEKVIFPERTTSFLLHSLNDRMWTLKYAVFSWFSDCLGTPKRQASYFD
ncbi:hypothetical protein Tcan_02061, partial [Toxocara canis]